MPRRRSKKTKKSPRRLIYSVLALLVVLSLAQFARATFIFPIIIPDDPPTPNGGSSSTLAPYGANVYQGLIAVTSGEAGAKLMEIGNNGQDIASTDTIELRPDYLTGVHSVRVAKNTTTGRADLYAPGGVCFSSGTCYDAWPTGSGVNYWTTGAGPDQTIQPSTLANAINFTPATANSSFALELVGNTPKPALQVTKVGSNPINAAAFDGGATINNNLLVDQITSGPTAGKEIVIDRNGASYPFWHAGNDGHSTTKICKSGPSEGTTCNADSDCGAGNYCNYTGPDASSLDGIPLEIRTLRGNSDVKCGNQSPGGVDLNCFCAFSGGYSNCIALQ